MSEPAEIDSNANYRTEFTSVSLGTEQELQGALVGMKTADPQLIGVVRAATSPHPVLVEITKDMQQRGDTTDGEFTIELRTTPCELSAKAGWDDRTKAIHAVIVSISGREGTPLVDDTYHGYQISISNKAHSIYSPAQITGADRQATVGIVAAEIGKSITAENRANGRIHEHLLVPWYVDKFTEDVEVTALSDREKIGYALMMSAILQLARIWRIRGINSVNHVEAKNLWVLRPRTPPIEILDTFSGTAAETLRSQIGVYELPYWAIDEDGTGPSDTNWEEARQHILDAEPMGGHQPPAATINGQAAMLFEYRQAPATYEDAFWSAGKWQLLSG